MIVLIDQEKECVYIYSEYGCEIVSFDDVDALERELSESNVLYVTNAQVASGLSVLATVENLKATKMMRAMAGSAPVNYQGHQQVHGAIEGQNQVVNKEASYVQHHPEQQYAMSHGQPRVQTYEPFVKSEYSGMLPLTDGDVKVVFQGKNDVKRLAEVGGMEALNRPSQLKMLVDKGILKVISAQEASQCVPTGGPFGANTGGGFSDQELDSIIVQDSVKNYIEKGSVGDTDDVMRMDL